MESPETVKDITKIKIFCILFKIYILVVFLGISQISCFTTNLYQRRNTMPNPNERNPSRDEQKNKKPNQPYKNQQETI